MSLTLDAAATAARLRAVDDHIRFECAHEVDHLMATFGPDPEWHNRAAEQLLRGHDAIRDFYAELFRGFPDFRLNVLQRHLAQESIVVEGILGGAHTGDWMTLKPTEKTVAAPFCAIFTFTTDNRLKSEIVYYDRFSLLSQLGVINLPS